MFGLDEFPKNGFLGVICGRFIDIQTLSIVAPSTISNSSNTSSSYWITIETRSDVTFTRLNRVTADSYLLSPNGRIVLENSIVIESSANIDGPNSIEMMSQSVETFL